MIRGIILALVVLQALAQDDSFFTENTKVIELTDSNFEDQIKKSNKPWFVKVYAPWCGHCKRLAPTWKELASELQGEVNVGAVDATAETVLARRFRVSGYPSLYFSEDGINFASFPRGPRDLESLRKFALEGYKNVPEEEVKKLADGSFIESIVESFTFTLKALLQMMDRFMVNNGFQPWGDTAKIIAMFSALCLPFVAIGLCACFCCKEPSYDDPEPLIKEKDE